MHLNFVLISYTCTHTSTFIHNCKKICESFWFFFLTRKLNPQIKFGNYTMLHLVYLGLFLCFRFLWGDIPNDWCPGERCLVCGRPHIWWHFTIQKTARLANLSGCSWTLNRGSCVDRPIRAVQQNQIPRADPQYYLQVRC